MARAVSSTAMKARAAGLGRRLRGGDHLLRALADLRARMSDLLDGCGGLLHGRELLLDAGGLLLRRGADFGRRRIEVLGGLAALARNWRRPRPWR